MGKALGSRLGSRFGTRLGESLAPGFAPPHLSRSILWLDSQVGLSSGEWVDQSPEGNTLTEATNPPAVSTINGLPSVKFTAASSTILGNSAITGWPISSSVTSFIVMDHANTAPYFFESSTDGTTNKGYIHADFGGPGLHIRTWPSPSPVVGGAHAVAAGTMLVVEGMHRHNNYREILVDGVSLGTNTNTVNMVAQNQIQIGGRFGGSSFFDGHMQAVVIFPEELSAGDRTEVRDWLTARFLP